MKRRYEQCRVCKSNWNVSKLANIRTGTYMCPHCRFKERAKKNKKKKEKALHRSNDAKPKEVIEYETTITSIIQH